ncbi:MAG: putative toxin-antitoxin system toxin component, PIN family [Chlamydiae bacterium]|nr:putative toxin-antitoxin system toxin component, PIN family [Chlamydiota bacterium]MBI3265550.1 putative toxin-antitoxin system toxin component, PIN family [Chlamydiota bacterium]
MKVLLDSNVIVAAFAARGLCHALFEVCLAKHQIVLGPYIVDEVKKALREKIKLPSGKIEEIVFFLKSRAFFVEPVRLSENPCRDAKDLQILALAVSAKARCLITGDKDLLFLKRYQSILILTPREFWDFSKTYKD